jgi:hypothetical protein
MKLNAVETGSHTNPIEQEVSSCMVEVVEQPQILEQPSEAPQAHKKHHHEKF